MGGGERVRVASAANRLKYPEVILPDLYFVP